MNQPYAEFNRRLGDTTMRELMTPIPVVALSGDALTGKSTLARRLAAKLGWRSLSSGTFARELCEQQGLEIANAAHLIHEDEDVAVDLHMAHAMARPCGGPAVIDGRLAVHIGEWLRGLGKQQIFCIYLRAPLEERLVRHVGRHLGERVQSDVQRIVSGHSSLETRISILRVSPVQGMDDVLATWEGEQQRDVRDRGRLESVWGFDYAADPPADLIIDTSVSTPEETLEMALKAIRATPWALRRLSRL